MTQKSPNLKKRCKESEMTIMEGEKTMTAPSLADIKQEFADNNTILEEQFLAFSQNVAPFSIVKYLNAKY